MAGKIFVNYRRDDERAFAARVRDRLARAFGPSNVFMDVDNLMAGQRFDRELRIALAQTDVFLAVIGPRWMELLKSRADAEERDYVREEIAEALTHSILVIPVLVEKGALPRRAELPEDIRSLVLHQKHQITHERFGRDVDDLVAAIRVGRRRFRSNRWSNPQVRWALLSVVLFALALGGGLFAYHAGAPLPWETRSVDRKTDDERVDIGNAKKLTAALVGSQDAAQAAQPGKSSGTPTQSGPSPIPDPVTQKAASQTPPPSGGCHGVETLVANERRCLRPKDSFKDCPECPEMVVVPAGGFTMGSLVGEEGRESHEGPQRTVTIGTAFAVGKFEVTFAEWDECVAAGGCKHNPADQGWGRGQRPVINVSWDDITREYLPWLSRKTGQAYILLTEAQWEYAARAGTTTPFTTGHTIANHEASFNGGFTYDGRAKGVYRDKTIEVGSFKANTFGLHDMHGNVWEWVQDCWKENYVDAPTDGSVWTTQECRLRVVRGGSWNFYTEYLRSASRLKARQDIRFNFFGFRVGRKF